MYRTKESWTTFVAIGQKLVVSSLCGKIVVESFYSSFNEGIGEVDWVETVVE